MPDTGFLALFLVGLLGGVCLHSPRFRARLGPLIRRLMPAGLIPPSPRP